MRIGGDLGPGTFRPQLLDCTFFTVNLNLAGAFLQTLSHFVAASWDSEPPHSRDSFVDHETKGVGNVAFEGLSGESHSSDPQFSLKQFAERSHHVGRAGVNLEVELRVFLLLGDIAINVDSLNCLQLENGFVRCLLLEILLGVLRLLQLLEQLVDRQSELVRF
jgi:hypothetical protein